MNRSPTALSLLLAAMVAGAETMIGGDIHELTFGPDGNPYVVEQDAFVPEGTSLTVQAGSVLMFRPFTGLKVDGGITVEGTPGAPVVITSAVDTSYQKNPPQLPNAFDWNGIQLGPSCPNASFAHTHIRFGTYGIQSSTTNVVVDNCVFFQNGQFHLKVGEKLHYVQDNVPCSYNTGAAATPAVKPPVVEEKRGKDKWEIRTKRPKKERRKLAVRYVCLGAAVAGLAAGTYYSIRTSDFTDQRDASPAGPVWDGLEDERSKHANGAIASFVVGGAFLLGFGVTFFF
jgi:hypothetical protein